MAFCFFSLVSCVSRMGKSLCSAHYGPHRTYLYRYLPPGGEIGFFAQAIARWGWVVYYGLGVFFGVDWVFCDIPQQKLR